MKQSALIVKEDGLIYVNEVPEEPSKPGSWAHQEFFTEYYEDDLPAYNKALASAKETAVLCADQEKATNVLLRNGFIIEDGQQGHKPGVYPIPDLQWERKGICCSPMSPNINHHGDCDKCPGYSELAILTLSEQPKGELFKDLTPEMSERLTKHIKFEPKGEESQEDAKPIRCPFCDSKNTLTMKQVTETKIKGSRVIKGIFDVWECSQCGEGFTKHWQIIPIDTDNA